MGPTHPGQPSRAQLKRAGDKPDRGPDAQLGDCCLVRAAQVLSIKKALKPYESSIGNLIFIISNPNYSASSVPRLSDTTIRVSQMPTKISVSPLGNS